MSIQKLFRNIALGAAASLMIASNALAQSKVLVVDTNRLLSESEVGKHIERQLQTIEKSMGTELNTSMSPLKAKGESLEAELKGKSQQELQQTVSARPDIQKKLVEVQQGKQLLAREVKVKQYEMAATEKSAQAQVADKVKDIITRLAKERGADVVLEKSLVIYGDPVDITDTVMAKLNTELPRITVVRKRLPQAPATAATAPKQ